VAGLPFYACQLRTPIFCAFSNVVSDFQQRVLMYSSFELLRFHSLFGLRRLLPHTFIQAHHQHNLGEVHVVLVLLLLTLLHHHQPNQNLRHTKST
jgi:hypothetical protein